MDKKPSRKERRAEQFGHSSPSRILYSPKFEELKDHSYIRDVNDAYREMREDVRCQKIEHFFNNKMPFMKDDDTEHNPISPQYRDELFFLTH